MRHEHIVLLALAALAIGYIVWQSGRFRAVVEGYATQANDAALVCYWAPQPPPGIVPTRPDPAGVKHTDGPRFSDVMAPFNTTSPMIQEKSNKTLLLESASQGISGDVDRKAYVESTVAPQQILGTLALAPTPPAPTHMPTTLETTVVPESSPPTPPVTSTTPAPEPATMMPMPVVSLTTEPQPTFAPTTSQPATIVA